MALRLIPSARIFASKAEEHIKGMVAPGTLFEELGFNYVGPMDGHNVKEIIRTLRNLNDTSGPKLLHLITKKGITFVTPTVKDLLVDNNYKVIQTKLFKDPHFILLDDVVKVTGN